MRLLSPAGALRPLTLFLPLVPFHTVLFPGYLLGSGDKWTMLNSISTTGACDVVDERSVIALTLVSSTEYLQYEGTKFSKSKNVGVFGQNARETGVPASVWRYYLLMNRPEASDSEFTWDSFVALANAELLNNLGNFVNRMLKFAVAKLNGVVPDPRDGAFDGTQAYDFAPEDESFVTDINKLLASYIDQLDHQKIRGALMTLMQITGRGNQFIQDNRVDNTLLQNDPKRCAEVVLLALNLIYLVAALTHPFMPATSDSILAQLDAIPRSIPDTFSIDLLPGHKLGTPAHLFSRIDPANIPKWRAAYGGEAAKAALAGEGEPKLSKKAQDKARKAAQKAAAEAEAARPKSDEELVLLAKIKEQGDKIRRIKQGDKQDGDASLEEELARLKVMKEEVDALAKSLGGVQI